MSTFVAKNTEISVSAVLMQLVYGWYSYNSLLIGEPGVYLRPGVHWNTGLRTPAFI